MPRKISLSKRVEILERELCQARIALCIVVPMLQCFKTTPQVRRAGILENMRTALAQLEGRQPR